MVNLAAFAKPEQALDGSLLVEINDNYGIYSTILPAYCVGSISSVITTGV